MRTIRLSRTPPSRVVVLTLLGLIVVLLLSANGIARVYTDRLWFDELGFVSVWNKVIRTQLVLIFVFGLAFFGLLWGNLYLADRLAPPFRATNEPDDVVERFHESVAPHAAALRLAISALFGLIAGLNSAGRWTTWMLFNNGEDFGWQDPLFGHDAGYYVFRLPFWTFLIDWLFAALVFVLLLSLIAHYLNGGIRAAGAMNPNGARGQNPLLANPVKLHISALLAVLAVVRSMAYWHDRYELVTSTRGGFVGALATDVNIVLPGLNLLTVVSLFCAALFVANLTRPGWGLSIAAIGLWAITHVVVIGIYPALYQRINVESDRLANETRYVERNIEATRFAFGLDTEQLESVSYGYDGSFSIDDLSDWSDVIDDIAVVDPHLTTARFARSQGEREYYAFADPLDVDRYEVDGEPEPVVLGARGLSLNAVPSRTWENQHVVYTHGNGVVIAAGDDVEARGEPSFLLRGIGSDLAPTDDSFEVDEVEPYLYYSENLPGYAIVGIDRDEVDYPEGSKALFEATYKGGGGVRLDSALRRAAYSVRFSEVRLFFSDAITGDVRVIYHRDVEERVQQVAPFLEFDSDPYPVVVDGEVIWVLDGYTSTDRFPYAQAPTSQALEADGLRRGENYVRNSVKATVDAYDGTVTLYVIDDDPIIEAWARAFPALFKPGSEAPMDLQRHYRYPADLFEVQTEMWATYQVSTPEQLIQGNLAWSVARKPSARATLTESPSATVPPTTSTTVSPLSPNSSTSSGRPILMPPQYRLTRLPGETETEFVLQRAFVPRSGIEVNAERSEMTAVMVARSDPGHYGELILYRLPPGNIPAPDLVDQLMRNEASEFITDVRNSTVEFGEMQIVLLADSVVFVRPLYLTSSSGTGAPELTRVLAANGDRIAMASTVGEAVAAVAEPAEAGEGGSTSPTSPDEIELEGLSVSELVAVADELLARADAAEIGGDAEGAAWLRAEARRALAALDELIGGDGSAPEVVTGEA